MKPAEQTLKLVPVVGWMIKIKSSTKLNFCQTFDISTSSKQQYNLFTELIGKNFFSSSSLALSSFK